MNGKDRLEGVIRFMKFMDQVTVGGNYVEWFVQLKISITFMVPLLSPFVSFSITRDPFLALPLSKLLSISCSQ